MKKSYIIILILALSLTIFLATSVHADGSIEIIAATDNGHCVNHSFIEPELNASARAACPDLWQYGDLWFNANTMESEVILTLENRARYIIEKIGIQWYQGGNSAKDIQGGKDRVYSFTIYVSSDFSNWNQVKTGSSGIDKEMEYYTLTGDNLEGVRYIKICCSGFIGGGTSGYAAIRNIEVHGVGFFPPKPELKLIVKAENGSVDVAIGEKDTIKVTNSEGFYIDLKTKITLTAVGDNFQFWLDQETGEKYSYDKVISFVSSSSDFDMSLLAVFEKSATPPETGDFGNVLLLGGIIFTSCAALGFCASSIWKSKRINIG